MHILPASVKFVNMVMKNEITNWQLKKMGKPIMRLLFSNNQNKLFEVLDKNGDIKGFYCDSQIGFIMRKLSLEYLASLRLR